MILKNTGLDPYALETLEPLTSVDIELLYQILLYCKPDQWQGLCVKFEQHIDQYLNATSQHRTSLLSQWSRRQTVVVIYAAANRLQAVHNLHLAFQHPNLLDQRDTEHRRLARAELVAAVLAQLQQPELMWPFEHESPWECRNRNTK